jgi:beta-fructofuranosidase
METYNTYAPEDMWLWDPWFIKEGDTYHMFHLQSPKMEDSEQRHNHATIGHATSKDLIHWETLSNPLSLGEEGEWDDMAHWTGSVIKKGDLYYLFYTGRGTQRSFYSQHIGYATSKDLITWKKHPKNPISTSGKHYCSTEDGEAHNFDGIPAWRDPFVREEPNTAQYFMAIAGRAKKDAVNRLNGCVALETSPDLETWTDHPPIFSPHTFDQIEVPQIWYHRDQYYLFFASKGLHCYTSSELHGRYHPVNENGIVYLSEEIYPIQIIEQIQGDMYRALGSYHTTQDESFAGKLSKPLTLELAQKNVQLHFS